MHYLMIIIKGVNVWPTQVEALLLEKGYSSNYLLIVDRKNNQDYLEILVENVNGIMNEYTQKQEIGELEHSLKSVLGIKATVKLVDVGMIQRSEGKSLRVIDNRRLY